MAQGVRNPNGQFAKGNPGGPGNPYARQVARLRRLILQCVTDADLKAIIRALKEKAKGGDVAAAREVLTLVPDSRVEGPGPASASQASQLLAAASDSGLFVS